MLSWNKQRAWNIRDARQRIRPYLQQISDTALWQLCAMAKDGEIVFTDGCRCIRGIVGGGTMLGYGAECSPNAIRAEGALNDIGYAHPYGDEGRNIRLLPMCRAEIRRRARLKAQSILEAAAAKPATTIDEAIETFEEAISCLS